MNAGVATDTAATIYAFFVCPMKNVSARLYISTISMLIIDGITLLNTAFGTGAFANISVVLSFIYYFLSFNKKAIPTYSVDMTFITTFL